MKRRHIEGYRLDARMVLKACHIKVGQDFHTLASWQVDALLEHADRDRYRKPKNANGSRGRYYHDMLQRRAQMVVPA